MTVVFTPAGGANSVTTPVGGMRPSFRVPNWVNQRLPSGPAAMTKGPPGVGGSRVVVGGPEGVGESVTTPVRVMRPILPATTSANHRLPSGPTVMPSGPLAAVGTANSVTKPVGVMRPILPPHTSVNQRLPSGPTTMSTGLRGMLGALPLRGSGNSVSRPVGVRRPIRLVEHQGNHAGPS